MVKLVKYEKKICKQSSRNGGTSNVLWVGKGVRGKDITTTEFLNKKGKVVGKQTVQCHMCLVA